MPKRGGGRVRNWKADNDYFEHDRDDRAHNSNTRRVSFKPGTNKRQNKFNKNWNESAKLLLDDDIDMAGNAGQVAIHKGGFRGRGGRLNSPAPRSHLAKRKFIVGMLPWYQIIIPYGAKHEKEVILKALYSHLQDRFIPHYYKISGNAAIFYVDDVKIAEKLYNADRKIIMSDGFKLVLIVKNSVPNVAIDAEMKEKMKLTMAKRYNAATKALDLTKFHADPDLADIFCALFRPMIMLAAIDIIAENIPDLEALNLNDNKLHGLEHMKILATKFKNLKILYMGDNRIPFLGSLEPLKNLPLVELYLKGNPLVNRFQDHEIYVR
uniref:Uncharacterized protein n=1 Tax=Pectinophora gossypiella TaxID=13191 RepID=A0A1E1WJI8_PECGO